MTQPGWNADKVAAYRKAFFSFLKYVQIDSKDKGGGYCLADGVYEAQFRFLDGIFEGLANDIHDFKILKSRQLGISTISEALFVFLLGMIKGVQAAVVFDTNGHLKSARVRIRNLIQRLPKSFGYPKITEDSRDMMVFSTGTKIVWMAAGVRETESSGGLGRGEGINLLWASEVSSWKNEEGIESLQKTLSEQFPDRIFIWESTARGYNTWRDMWVDAKADSFGQKGIFIGWWAHPGHVIARTDRRFPMYGEKPPTDIEQVMIEKVWQQYGHKITTEELAWYRYRADPNKKTEGGTKRRGQFLAQEEPSTEEDAFQQAGSSFFDHNALNNHTRMVAGFPRPKIYRYEFGVEFTHTVINPATRYNDVHLKVWNEPEPGVEYILAADPAFGRNPDNDRSAIQVIACYADCVEQVAEYACATTNTTQFAWVIATIAAWYKKVAVIIEIDGPGEAVWKEWQNIPTLVRSPYMRASAEERGLTDVFNNVRNYIFNRPDSMAGRGNNWQWKTSNRKEAIMEKLRSMVETQGQIIIKSMETIEEMRKIARDGASIEAPSHKHDDRAVALAIALRAWEDELRPQLLARNITRAAYQEAKKMTSQGRYAIFMQNSISGLFQANAKKARDTARAQKQLMLTRRRGY